MIENCIKFMNIHKKISHVSIRTDLLSTKHKIKILEFFTIREYMRIWKLLTLKDKMFRKSSQTVTVT